VETGTVATSYIPTTGTSATRAVDAVAYTPNIPLTNASGCVAVCLTPTWTGSANNPGGEFFASVAAGTFLYSNTAAAEVGSFEGTYIAAPVSWTAGVEQCFRHEWSAAGRTITNVSTGAATSTATPWSIPFTTASYTATAYSAGGFYMRKMVVGKGPGKCQQ
jgi:hypothetical protein